MGRLGFLLCFLACPAFGATLLPPGEIQFADGNGKPYAGGTVTFYIPSTSTPKNTWQDPGQTILNTNPVILDANGRAIIYGTGTYREILQDSSGNIIWDQLTADTSATAVSTAGVSTGTANNQIISAANFSSQDQQTIIFRAGFTNTTTLVLTVNGISVGVLVDTKSGAVLTSGGEVILGNEYQLIYDASRGAFHLTAIPPVPGLQATLVGATTTDLGTIPSHYVSVSGAATITSFGSTCSSTSPIYYVTFTGASVLTASAGLILPGGNSITTASGDSLVASCAGTGN